MEGVLTPEVYGLQRSEKQFVCQTRCLWVYEMQITLVLNPQGILPCSTDFGAARVGRLCSEFVDEFRNL